MFLYGEVYDHDQLNDATHEALHEAFGVANMTTFDQITLALREGHMVAADGADVYLPATDNLRVPIDVPARRAQPAVHARGQPADLRLPPSRRTAPTSTRAPSSPDYAHMDLFVGKDAARDVYPVLTADARPLQLAHPADTRHDRCDTSARYRLCHRTHGTRRCRTCSATR